MFSSLTRPALVFAASAALGACTMYDGYGGGVVSVGYSTGGYYGSGYDRYPYYGWYDGFYYPGAGYYVYDRGGSRHRWSDRHRRYWEGRRGDRAHRENWSGWRGEQFAGRPGGEGGQDRWQGRGERQWQGRGERNPQAWQGRRQRDDRQQWQGRGRRAQQSAPAQSTPAPAPRTPRAEPAQRPERVERAREFGKSKDNRRD